jgi:RND family efflux transporter MFP subunit
MRILIVLGLPVLAIIAVMAMVSMKAEPPKKERVDLDPIVDVIELKLMSVDFEVQSQGTVRPRTETILSAEVSGTITEISPKFVAGGVFQENEVLMRIDPTNYTVELRQAQALVKQRQIEFDGASKLREQGYRAEAELASAAAALATAKANMVRAQRNLQRTYIRLPYEGIVRAKETDLGQFVNAGTRLGVTFATDFAEIRLPLTDNDLAFVDLPDAAEMTASGSVDGPSVVLTATQKGLQASWPATIVRSEGVVDESSRVTYAVARVTDPYRLHTDGNSLPVGTFVAATIQGSTVADVFRLPRGVVRGSDELIFVDGDNTLSIRVVNILRSDAQYVYVNEGANAGERIVTTAIQTPVNGMPVRIAGEAESTVETAEVASSLSED